jgi:cytochrome bd-type quinol oxidase subunit 1
VRSVISHFQRQEGRIDIRALPRSADHEYWGVTVPMAATGLCLAAFLFWMVLRCAGRRRPDLMVALVTYGMVLGTAWALSFGWLLSEMSP